MASFVTCPALGAEIAIARFSAAGTSENNFVLRSNQKKERERFYLLAGMGGSAAKRKHRRILKWAIAAGLVVSIGFGVMLYFFNRFSK